MAFYFFLAMACVSIVKSVQNGLYLFNIGVDWRLPLIYVALAVVSGPVVFLYRRLAGRYSAVWLTSCTLLFFVAMFALFWFLIHKGETWTYLAFYLLGGIFSVLIPTQGWMISNQLYTTRKAKRLFSVLGTGGILGGASGGFYTALVAERSVPALLIHVLILLVGLQFVLLATYRRNRQFLSRENSVRKRKDSDEPDGSLYTIRKIVRSRYLGYLAVIVLTAGFASTLIDLQYKLVLKLEYPASGEQITQFFGVLLGSVFVSSALFQLFATSRVLSRFGVGLGLLILPVALVAGSTGVIIATAFAAVVILKAIDGSFRSSIDRTTVELLYVPISNHDTMAVKGFIDMMVFRFGDALAAAVFLSIFTFVPDAALRVLGLVVLCAALGWVYVSRQLGKEYLRTLRRSLEIKPSSGVRRALEFEEAVAERTLVAGLKSANPRKVHFVLQQLTALNSEEEHLEDLSSQGEEMLSTQMSGIYEVRSPRWLNLVAPLVTHPDQRVSSAAFHILLRYRPDELRRLRKSFNSETIPRTLYLVYLDAYVENPERFLKEEYVLRWCKSATPDQSILLARIVGKTKNRAYLPVLQAWMSGPPSERGRAAIEAIGRFADPQFLDILVRRLGERWSRRAARRALVLYGDSAVPDLLEVLRTTSLDLSVRREIPAVLARIGTESSRAALVAGLYLPDSIVSFRSLKGLNKIRDVRDLSYGPDSFFPVLQIWAKQYYELVNLDLLLEDGNGHRAWKLLHHAVKERKEWTLEKIFRGLGLFFPHGDAYVSYIGYTSERQELRENAIELIDSHIKGEIRQTLLPILTEPNQEKLAKTGRELFGISSDLEAIFADELLEGDPWLKCCIIAAIASRGMQNLKQNVRQALDDISPMVRETAHWATAVWTKKEQTAPAD